MLGIFKSKKKTPQDVVKALINAIALYDTQKDEKTVAKATAKMSKYLGMIKTMLYGDEGHGDKQGEHADKLVELIFQNNLLLVLVNNIRKFEFEAKKDIAQVFNFVLRQKYCNEAVAFIRTNFSIFNVLTEGYDDANVALPCGNILRLILRHEELAKYVFQSKLFLNFFEYVQKPNFDISSDAFATFKELRLPQLLLTRHKELAAKVLDEQYDEIFSRYTQLIQSNNYVTKRQSLKLLGEVLLDRSNFNVMMRYINDQNNLKILMNLLRQPSKTIQFEAFHVFKVFVANPNKTPPILEILLLNKEKLIEFLKAFRTDKDSDQFNDEKKFLLETMEKLGQPQSNEKKDEKKAAEKKDEKKK